jgi:hypothetical protein
LKTVFAFMLTAAIWWPDPSYAQTKNADLIGNYAFSGTETDGKPSAPGTLVITMDKSGALDLNCDGGQYVGIGQVAGNVLAIATVAEGKEVILIMNINADGSLEGRWWRRTDPGTQGVEVWKKK